MQVPTRGSRGRAPKLFVRSRRGPISSQDRPDLAHAAKELCKELAAPTTNSLEHLERLIKYPVACPRLLYHFHWQSCPVEVNIVVDTDFAGCRVTRRSTSGGAALRGGHCLRHWSSAQGTNALSSCEIKLEGLCRGAANGIGFRSMAHELGLPLKILLRTDATAAIGMSRCLGAGRVRHLDTSLVWIQNTSRSEAIRLSKVAGAENCADILTRYVNHSRSTDIWLA